MENAILYAGIEELNTIKAHVEELNEYQEKNAELEKEEARLEKLVAAKEKSLTDEIDVTLKKRKSELVASYESQITALNTRSKKVKTKKEKAKGTKVTERISMETAELREDIQVIQAEIKVKMKSNKVPKLCNSLLFFSFFMPKAPGEFLILLAGLLLAFLALPMGVYWFLLAERFGEIALAITYLITVLVFGGSYLIINNAVKERYLDTLRVMKKLRSKIRKDKRNIRRIQRGIRKDSDESTYGLEQYDEELAEIDAEIRKIASEEREAVNTFDNETALQIKEEIEGRYQEELTSLRSSYETTCANQKQTENQMKELARMLSKQYEAYLGKETLNVAKLDKLIAHIQSGEAKTIGEALALENNK